jgi:prevent-host-death family protein
MEERRMGIDAARPKLGDLADDAERLGQPTILTLHNRPLAAIVSLREAGGRDLITEQELEEALRVLAVRPGSGRTCQELARAVFGYVLRARTPGVSS